MPTVDAPKLLARNVAAVRRFSRPVAGSVAGNPVSSRLESGVGNCFPGLECDLRNLERRFLPFLEIEFQLFQVNGAVVQLIQPVAVDAAGVSTALANGELSQSTAEVYGNIGDAIAAARLVAGVELSGTFGILGQRRLDLTQLDGTNTAGPNRNPPDAWTAVRMLTELFPLEVTFIALEPEETFILNTTRARYLDDNGALSAMFLPGELTQSLCSPWTHDFRDCGCFYWASNHPDIAQPVFPAAVPPADIQSWTTDVPWQRRDRPVMPTPPAPANTGSSRPVELRHYEINRRWQELHFVVGRRETTLPFKARKLSGTPLPNLHPTGASALRLGRRNRSCTGISDRRLFAESRQRPVARRLRAVTRRRARNPIGADAHRDRRDAAHAGRQRRHPRIDAARHLRTGAQGGAAAAAGVSRRRPTGRATPRQQTGARRLHLHRSAFGGRRRAVFRYSGDLPDPRPTSVRSSPPNRTEAISSIIAEGEDHYQTFLDIKEWLAPHLEADYLRNVNPPRPAPGQAQHDTFQVAYAALLEDLHTGYEKGRLAGAAEVNAARVAMIGTIDPLAHAVAEAGFLVAFDNIADPRFRPIDPP